MVPSSWNAPSALRYHMRAFGVPPEDIERRVEENMLNLRRRRDLERAAATPVPDDDDLADNAMNLRRRVMGQ